MRMRGDAFTIGEDRRISGGSKLTVPVRTRRVRQSPSRASCEDPSYRVQNLTEKPAVPFTP